MHGSPWLVGFNVIPSKTDHNPFAPLLRNHLFFLGYKQEPRCGIALRQGSVRVRALSEFAKMLPI